MATPAALEGQVVRQLQTAHALKAGALRMFDPMLAAVAKARDAEGMAEVADLLGRMHRVFSGHREETASHATRLVARLRDLEAGPARGKLHGMSAGAIARAQLGGRNFGADARDAFVFEHLEIATLHLLEQAAERAGDAETAELARACRADDEEMAGAINRNWTNVLSLALASKGIPPMRPIETPDAE